MRYQDRLLSLLPGGHPQVSRYLCRELEGLAAPFDSERIVAALDAQAQHDDPGVALQAALSSQRFLPAHLEAQYAPETWPAGPRLSRAIDLSGISARHVAATGPAAEGQARSAIHLLGPAVEALVDSLGRLHGKQRQRAFRALAHVAHGAAAEAVRKLAVKEGAEAGPLALHAVAAHTRAGNEGALLKLVTSLEGTWLYPAAVAALALAPFDAVHDFLVTRASRASAEAAPSFAAALESFGSFGVLRPLESLAARGSGWTALQALQTLARLRDEKALGVIETIYWRHEHPSVREAAVRAAGAIKTEASAGFLRTVLSSPQPGAVAARALQSLQGMTGDAGSLARLAALHLDSSDTEASVSAVLASLVGDEAAAVGRLRRLVRSGTPFLRAQGAYCLAYYQGRVSLQFLTYLAQKDPDPAVRRQAIASLAAYETTPLVREILLELLASATGDDLRQLAAVLARADIAQDSGAADALVAAAERHAGTPEGRALHAALGRITFRTATDYLQEKLRASTDPEDVLSLLGALDLLGASGSEIKAAAHHADPRVRARAATLLWNQGEEYSVEILRDLLRAPGPEGLQALEEAAVAGARLAFFGRFRALGERLRANAQTREFQAFAASELSLSVPRAAARQGFDPNANLAERSGWRDKDEAGLGGESPDASMSSAMRQSAVLRAATPPVFATDGLDTAQSDPRHSEVLVYAAIAIGVALVCVAIVGLLS